MGWVKPMDKKTTTVKKKYDRIATIFDLVDHMILPSWRKKLLKNLEGYILEVGVGTGANLRYYNENAHVVGIDFSRNMLRKAKEKVHETAAKVELIEMDIQNMDFPDHMFDYVVSTCVFCSVPNPVVGLREIRRVVKPKGKILMLEHMRSENRFTGKILDIVNPLATFVSGVNVNRETVKNIENAGMTVHSERYLMTSIMRELIVIPNK